MKPPEIYTSLDLELNQNEISGPRIIQIGTVVGNIVTGEILERLSIIINCDQVLEPRIIELTKITQKQVDSGVTLIEAFEQLQALHKKYASFCNPIVWGNGDVRALVQELDKGHGYKVPPELFGRRELDAKTIYCAWRIANGKFPVGGLKKAINNFGLKFIGRPHDALADAETTMLIFRHMISLLKK